MGLPANAKDMQLLFINNGYTYYDELYNTQNISRNEFIDSCYIIARKENFVIIHVDAQSNWRSIATELISKNNDMCLVITHITGSYYVFSTPIHDDGKKRSAHVVINDATQQSILTKFIAKMRIKQEDTDVGTTLKMKKAFTEFKTYEQAIDEFDKHLEMAIRNTRDVIVQASTNNKKYDIESEKFLEMCRKVISNKLELGDITELLLQHVMTYRIFALIYDEHELHTTNAIARSLEGLMNTLEINIDAVSTSYKTIELVAESITDVTEKQDFLKQVYETFYAKYDPKNKDSWGIAYTPSEVVDFMVRSTEYLLEKHFKNSLSDDNVTILDPATGTGTFVTSILRHLKPDSLEAKYKNDIFANDISILAYYIAALNIENTYQEITGKIKEFENICWMDTLTSGTKDFGKLSAYIDGQDNVKRISRQQQKDICVVLGNPPYNAVQVSFNDANPTEKYPDIDKKIAETYVKNSSAKLKASAYDMYLRFVKWSSERIKDKGMVVFVSNNSFLDGKANSGFRKSVFEEFDYIYTVNLKGNARLAGDAWRRQGGKIFGSGARVGITITFFLKTGEGKSEIQYAEVDDYTNRENKLKWLADNSISTLPLRQIVPDENSIWLNQTDNDFDELVPVISDEENMIFGSRTHGPKSNRDDWICDFDKKILENKIKYFIDFYNKILREYTNEKPLTNLKGWVTKKIKWTDDLLKQLKRENKIVYSGENIKVMYRPFVQKFYYFDKILIERQGNFSNIFKKSKKNKLICFSSTGNNTFFQILATDKIMDYGSLNGSHSIPCYTYDEKNKSKSNITEFGLNLFQKHYNNTKIIDEDIFYYTYAIFNDPKYEKKYKFNLQRKFPRIPLAKNFKEWVKIGKKLYEIHVGFESAVPYPLKRIDKNTDKHKTKLQLKKSKNYDDDIKIIIDEQTTLEEIPIKALEYKFKSDCALEWILEFYKESKNNISEKSCDDPKIRERFNTYRFSDHKEYVIDLLQRVTTVSIETMKLRAELENMPYGKQPKWKSRESKKQATSKKPKKIGSKKIKSKKSKKKADRLQNTLDEKGQQTLS